MPALPPAASIFPPSRFYCSPTHPSPFSLVLSADQAPNSGNLDFRGSSLDIPIITQTLEELGLSALVPYRNAIATGKLDAVFVGGVAIASANMNVSHACLSDQVVDELLRQELGFDGVAISECLEMEALYQEIGVKGGTVMAVEAGCDLILLCKDYNVGNSTIHPYAHLSVLTDGLDHAPLTSTRSNSRELLV